MKLLLFAASFVILTVSCKKKQSAEITVPEGIWVETSLRLDTLDFNTQYLAGSQPQYAMVNFKSAAYTDTVLNPNYPVNHASLYNYYFSNGASRINMRSLYSSSINFHSFGFFMHPGGSRFSVDKFYSRRSLPGTVDFVRIR